MNRFEFVEPRHLPNESFLIRESGVSIVDGELLTQFSNGELTLTSHRILWASSKDSSQRQIYLALSLHYVVHVEEDGSRTYSSPGKDVVLHLTEVSNEKMPGPASRSFSNYVRLSFRNESLTQFISLLTNTIMRRTWELTPVMQSLSGLNFGQSESSGSMPMIKTRTGIIGIERSLQEKQKATDESISMAFQDLKKLMGMAKDMVAISKTISAKIRERQGDITEDETIRFKAYLMSLGIDDPVTRDAYKSSNEYFKQLAKQLAQILEEPIKEVGGMMTLTDVYCRVNRARGLELLSPEDLLNASRQLGSLGLPIILRVFDSGVMVLQLRSHDDKAIVEAVAELLEERKSITAEELAQTEGLSVTLARERLLATEKAGKACRDDSIEALRFYPNLFLTMDV
ncbi:vacuolar protein-sorting-associated protein 36 isoform X1 [Cephus cinctus]|uniref:Vacuolar protein-sorting-associated protein 36 n=1 Tax=Cephus cinctus TaxID=211228 RepID=A0AAJ7C703_CEPCN|nr:vacuolar protein-sorting-associated protein 36 isoform X1 [Cephus cinctus]XP_015603470.1 vacuolar protein-sorting-associated protein 36 isoform X1 [Cephus cinctus]